MWWLESCHIAGSSREDGKFSQNAWEKEWPAADGCLVQLVSQRRDCQRKNMALWFCHVLETNGCQMNVCISFSRYPIWHAFYRESLEKIFSLYSLFILRGKVVDYHSSKTGSRKRTKQLQYSQLIYCWKIQCKMVLAVFWNVESVFQLIHAGH